METRPFSAYSPLPGTNEGVPEREDFLRWISTRSYNFWLTTSAVSAILILAFIFAVHTFEEFEKSGPLMAEYSSAFAPLTPDTDDVSRLFDRKWPLPDASWRDNEDMQRPKWQDHQRLETLQLVQVIFRHGERNPLDSLGPLYPNDIEQFPGGWGQLTQRGQEQAFQLGQYLRQRYDGFLDQEYKSDQFFALSSGIDRTIITAMLALKGLYPNNHDSNENDNWRSRCSQSGQLVPLRTLDPDKDNLLLYSMVCPRFDDMYEDSWPKFKEIQQIETDNRNLLDIINQETGRNAKSWNDALDYIIDYVRVLIHQKRPLPTWVTKEMLKVMSDYVSQRISVSLVSPELKRFRSPIVQRLIDNMAEKRNPDSRKKMFLFSGHDITLSTILIVLGFKVNYLPPYTSSLMFELHKNSSNTEHHVEVYFRYTKGTEWREPLKMEIPHCPSPCLLSKLEELMSPLYIQDYERECQQQGSWLRLRSSASDLKSSSIVVTTVALWMVSKFLSSFFMH